MGATQVEMLMAGLVDASGSPLANGKVYSYSAGTVTTKALYLDKDKGATATNPVILDSLGQAEVWGDGSYKFVIKDEDDVTITTIDGLQYGTTTTAGTTGNVQWGSTSSNVSNAYSINVTGVSSYTAGDTYAFIVNATNTGAATLNVTGAGAKGIKKEGSNDLGVNDLIAGSLVMVVYDATAPGFFQLVANSGKARITGTAVDVDIWTTAWGKDVNLGNGGVKQIIVGNGDVSPNTDVDVAAINLGKSTKRYGKVYTGEINSDDNILKLDSSVAISYVPHMYPEHTGIHDLGNSSHYLNDIYLDGSIKGPVPTSWTINDAAIACTGATISGTVSYESEYWEGGAYVHFRGCFYTNLAGGSITGKIIMVNLPINCTNDSDQLRLLCWVRTGASWNVHRWYCYSNKLYVLSVDESSAFTATNYLITVDGKYKKA